MASIGLMMLSLAVVAPGDDTQYLEHVKPVLQKRCYACHGALRQQGHLRLDTAAFILRGGDNGPSVDPANSDESLLLQKVQESELKLRMPREGEPLSSTEIEALRRWIADGAPAPSEESPQRDPRAHWAFRVPTRPAIPDAGEHANPIDAFLARSQTRTGTVPKPQAERATLLRRSSLDLTGLAPKPEDLHAFLNDESCDAYERAVERLLASPHYGERWGRHWMDVWRYSDWYGWQQEVRHSQPHIWRWRDWIVESLNADKGYDQMIVEMLAADEVAPDDPAALRATGYLVRNWFKFNRHVWLQDTVDHTAKAFLGLTLACARCHDHKYDPILQDDYYRMRAFFEPHEIRTDRVPGQADTAKDGLVRVYDAHAAAPTYVFKRGDDMQPIKDRPLAFGMPAVFPSVTAVEPIALPPAAFYTGLQPVARVQSIEVAEAALAKTRGDLDAAVQAVVASAPGVERNSAELRSGAALADLTAAQAELASVRARIEADEARFASPLDSKRAEIAAHLAQRAEQSAKLLQAQADLARVAFDRSRSASLKPMQPGKSVADELNAKAKAARKRCDEANRALAKFSRDYSPIAPVYPATSTGRRLTLARWIASPANPLTARVAVNHIWMRHFGEPLVPTVFDFGNNGKPPAHPELLDWLAVEFMEHGWSLKHLHRLIVTSQAYRRASAWSDDEPSAHRDPLNITLWRMNSRRLEAELVRDNLLWLSGQLDARFGGQELDQSSALSTHRRSLYYRHAPEKQAEFLKLFDAANMEACYRRDVSIVPQQALALANSTLALASARTLAARLSRALGESTESNDLFIISAYDTILARPPRAEELRECRAFLHAQATRLADSARLTRFDNGPDCAVPPATDPRQRAREDLVHVLFNHNDFVTIR